MKHPVTAPSVGESITEVSILKWNKKTGEQVQAGEVLLEIESEKATVEVIAEASGAITLLKQVGEKVKIGELLAEINTDAKGSVSTKSAAPAASPKAPTPSATSSNASLSPAVKRVIEEKNLNPASFTGTGKDGRLTKGDVMGVTPSPQVQKLPPPGTATPLIDKPGERPGDRKEPMSRLRQKIAERLVHAQHTAAILTTFNEVDLSKVMALRSEHKEKFKTKNGVALSFMSFFTRAVVESLKLQPAINASIDGTDIVYHDYCDIGIAVGTERGLVVPVIRSTETMGFVEIERAIAALAEKARANKLSIADMSGGTFTISNGGTYGSLLSTPILNPPQSGILGMHKIMDRPVAVDGKVEIRPMMYLALSYDHRLIDGKEAVTFLVSVKNFLEDPTKLHPEFLNG